MPEKLHVLTLYTCLYFLFVFLIGTPAFRMSGKVAMSYQFCFVAFKAQSRLKYYNKNYKKEILFTCVLHGNFILCQHGKRPGRSLRTVGFPLSGRTSRQRSPPLLQNLENAGNRTLFPPNFFKL